VTSCPAPLSASSCRVGLFVSRKETKSPVSRPQTKTETDFDLCAEEEVAFLASHFHELESNAVSSMSFDEADAVIGHDSPVRESENAPLDAVPGLVDGARASGGSCDSGGLLRYVRPQHLGALAERAWFEFWCLRRDHIWSPRVV